MKNIKRPSIERIHKTEAYDILEAFCDDDKGGLKDVRDDLQKVRERRGCCIGSHLPA